MLTKYQKAKRKWFSQNVLSFEIFYSDGYKNGRVVIYDMDLGLRLRWQMEVESQSLYALCKGMEPWEIFFKFKNRFKSSIREDGLTIHYNLAEDLF